MPGKPLAVADEFETERLVIRAVRPDDMDALFEVYASNPGYLAFTEGSAGEPGHYDRGMLERDFAIAAMTPERRMLGLFRKPDRDLVGVLDWEESPSDGKPQIGLLMIRADQQRQGLATEVVQDFAQRLRAAGKSVLGAGVITRNAAGRALVERLGFEAVSTTTVRMASQEEVIVLERAL